MLYKVFSVANPVKVFILNYTWPVFLFIISVFVFKEKFTLRKVLAIFISFFGIIVIITNGKLDTINIANIGGDTFALLVSLSAALYSVIGKKKNFEKTTSVFWYFIFVLIFIVTTLFLFSQPKGPTPSVLFWIAINGIFINGVSFIFLV